MDVREKIEKVLAEFNRLHGSEANARFSRLKETK